jgi:hypothetical protein
MKVNKVKQKAERYYNKQLYKLHKIMGTGETHTHQLNNIGKRLFKHKYIGTFPADKIPKLKKNQMMIVNNQNSNQGGEHWLGICKTKDDTILIYDSFGRRHFKILPALSNSTNDVIKETENDPEQKKIQKDCGQRCLAFLKVFNDFGYRYAVWI